jgi:hypothetical protein
MLSCCFLILLVALFVLSMVLPVHLRENFTSDLGSNSLFTKYRKGSCASAINGVNKETDYYCVKGSNNFFDH